MKPSANLSFWRSAAAVIPILAISAIMSTPAAFAQSTYWVTDLGSLGGESSSAYGINNNGEIVGDSWTTNGVEHAFLYTGGRMVDLGTLSGRASDESHARGINNSTQVVGYSISTNGSQAFLYSAGTMIGLGPASAYSEAYSINDSGQVVGYWYYGTFLYSGGSMGNLGFSSAKCINNNGQIVGWNIIQPSPYGDLTHAFLYDVGTGLKDLGTLGGYASWAQAINTNGQVVGSSMIDYIMYSPEHAFLYSAGTMTDLGTLGGTNSGSGACSINNSGQVVGSSHTTNGPHAFLYSGAKMTDLNKLIPANPGWTLTRATAINDSGQIVGWGFNPSGQSHAFLLTPIPVPHRATASAVVSNGVVVKITVTDSGSGYTNPPTVLIQGGGGTGATATAVVSNGFVTSIIITGGGIGYTGTPSIYIYSPFGLQVGLIRAVTTSFSDLLVGTNYQLQISGDLNTWTNQNSPFTATNPAMIYPQYWDVDSWNKLFFRLQVAP